MDHSIPNFSTTIEAKSVDFSKLQFFRIFLKHCARSWSPQQDFVLSFFPRFFFQWLSQLYIIFLDARNLIFFWEKEKKKTTKGWKRSPPSGNWISIVDYFLWKRKELLKKKKSKTFEGHKVYLWQMNFSNPKFKYYYLYQNLFFKWEGKVTNA